MWARSSKPQKVRVTRRRPSSDTGQRGDQTRALIMAARRVAPSRATDALKGGGEVGVADAGAEEAVASGEAGVVEAAADDAVVAGVADCGTCEAASQPAPIVAAHADSSATTSNAGRAPRRRCRRAGRSFMPGSLRRPQPASEAGERRAADLGAALAGA